MNANAVVSRDEWLEAWEDAPEGTPQTGPYRWWRLHDEYAEPRPAETV